MRIIFVDIDGTILDYNRGLRVITEKTKEAFEKIKLNRDMVFICSGRSKCLLPKEILDLEPSGYILANGAYCEIAEKTIFSHEMEEDVLKNIMYFAIENKGAYYLETFKKIYTQDIKTKLHIDFATSWDVIDCYTDETFNFDEGINLCMLALNNDDSLISKAYKELSNYVDLNRQGDLYSFDLNIKNINKGTAIVELLNYLNQDYIETFAFGDGINDLEMMQIVNYPIVMDNACMELKEIAYDITDDVLNDGFYNGLIKHNIIK